MAGFNAPIQVLITDIAKKSMQKALPMLKAFTIGVDQGTKSIGDKARVFFYGTPVAATAYHATNNTYETGSAADLDHKDVELTDLLKITKPITNQQIRSGLDLQILMDGMIMQTARGAANLALSKILKADFGNSVHYGAATTLTSDLMADLAGTVAELGWDSSTLHAVLATTYYGNLIKDDDLKTVWGPQAAEMIRTGIAPVLSGWTAYRTPGFPTNNENLVGFLTDGSGLALGFAANDLQPGVRDRLMMYENVRDEATGFVIGIRMHANAENKTFLTTEVLCGAMVGRAEGLKRITSVVDA